MAKEQQHVRGLSQHGDARQRRLAAARGSYEAQRKLAAREADEQVALTDKGEAPQLEKVYRFALGALTGAVDLAKMSRGKSPPNAQSFVGAQTRLAEYSERIKAIPNWGEILRPWPTEPGITFSWKAGTSALDVALKFAEMINTAALVARKEIATHQGTSFDPLPVEPVPHARIKKWCKGTMRELLENAIPLDQTWPSMGEIHRESESLGLKLRHEFSQAVKSANGPWHPCDEGIVPIAEALERFASADPLELPKRLGAVSTRHSYELLNAFSFPGLGNRSKSAGRQEMVRRWLQTNGLAEDSKEMDGRIHHFVEQLRSFEQWAGEVMASRAVACREMERRGESVELIDRFGESVREKWDALQDEGGDLADYLRQLAVTIRGKLKATSQDSDSARNRSPDVDREAPVSKVGSKSAEGAAMKKSEAADFLNVTRGHVTRLVKANKLRVAILPTGKTGVCIKSVASYKAEREKEQTNIDNAEFVRNHDQALREKLRPKK